MNVPSKAVVGSYDSDPVARKQIMRSLIWFLFGLLSAHSFERMEQSLEIIRIYFNHRNINSINVFPCSEQEGIWLLRKLITFGFIVNIKFSLNEKDNIKLQLIVGWFVDLSCGKNLEFFKKISGINGAWLGFHASTPELNMSSLRLDSDLIVASDSGQLWDLFGKPFKTHSMEAGTWRPQGIAIPNRKTRYDLGGTVLRGVLLELELQFIKKNITDKIGDHNYCPEHETSERLSYVYFRNLATAYNFEIEMVAADTWGYLMSNGSYAGMVGMIGRGQADFGVTACAFRDDRMGAVAYSPHLQELRCIYMFVEERIQGTYVSLLLPFSFNVWICIFFVLVIGSVIFYILQKRDLTEGVIFVTAILSQQGLEKDAKRLSARVYSISLLFLGLILYSYYNAAIMNGLLSPAPPSIHNEDDLLRSELKASIAKVPYLIPVNNQKTYLTPRMLARAMENTEPMIDVFEGLKRLRHERFILISDDLALYAIIKDMYTDSEKCHAKEIEATRPFPLGHPIQKNSPFREMIAQGMLRLQENGLAKRDMRVWYPPRPHCFGSTVYYHVTLEAVGLAFTIFLSGTILSLCVLLSELMIKKFFSVKITKGVSNNLAFVR